MTFQFLTETRYVNRQWFDEDCACECAEKDGKREETQAQECSDRTVTYVAYLTQTATYSYTYESTYVYWKDSQTYTRVGTATDTMTRTVTTTTSDKPFQWVGDHCECECGGDENAAAAACDDTHPVWVHDNCECNCADRDEKDEAAQAEECEETRSDPDDGHVTWENHVWKHDTCECKCREVGGKTPEEQWQLCISGASYRQKWNPDVCMCECDPRTEAIGREKCEGSESKPVAHPGVWNSPDNPCKCTCPDGTEYDSASKECKCSASAEKECTEKAKTNPNLSWNSTTCNCDCGLKPEECYVGGKQGKISDDCKCVCADAGKQRRGDTDECNNTPVYEVQDDCSEKCAIKDGTVCIYDCSDLEHLIPGVWSNCACTCQDGAGCTWAVVGARKDCVGTLDSSCNCKCTLTSSKCKDRDPAYPDLNECDCWCECDPLKHGATSVTKGQGGTIVKCAECHEWNSSTCNCDDKTDDWKQAKETLLDKLEKALEKAEKARDGADSDLAWYAEFGDISTTYSQNECAASWGTNKRSRDGNKNAYSRAASSLFGSSDGKPCPATSPCDNGLEKQLKKLNDELKECIADLEYLIDEVDALKPCKDLPQYEDCQAQIDAVCSTGHEAYAAATTIHTRQKTVVDECPCEYETDERGVKVEVSCLSHGDYDPHKEGHLPFPGDHTSGLDGNVCGSGGASSSSAAGSSVAVEVRYCT